jgi:hypothetical protein
LQVPIAPATPRTRLVRREDGTFTEEPIRPPRPALAPGGRGIVDLNEVEADEARQRAAEESIRHQRESQANERAVEAAEHAEHTRLRDEQLDRECPITRTAA